MRVISQSGMFDFPYEQIVVCMDGKNVIARFIGIEKSNLLGSYSTEEKAEKAINMLHDEWIDYGNEGLFQFPADEEVEAGDWWHGDKLFYI